MLCVMGWSDVVVCVWCAVFVALGVCEVRCLLGIFECLELTRAFPGTHVCDCGIAWRITVLGAELLRAGARAFWGGERAMLGGRVYDVVVTPCDLRRLEMALLARLGSLLLLCLG